MMVKYSDFRDDLKWYYGQPPEEKILEVSNLLAGLRSDFDETLEEVENQFPERRRVQNLIGKASMVDREVRKYEAGAGRHEAVMAIYDVEDVQSSIIATRKKGFGRGTKFHPVSTSEYYYSVHPTTDVEKKIDDVLSDDLDYEEVNTK